METTIDAAGRVVIPKRLRDRLGLTAGTRIDIVEDGAGLRIELPASGKLIEVDGHLLIDGGEGLTDEMLRELRLADQR